MNEHETSNLYPLRGTGSTNVDTVLLNKKLYQLNSIIQDIAKSTDFQTLQTTVLTSVRLLLACDGVTFVHREGDYCYYADEDAIGPLWKGQRFPLSMCISGWVMLNKQYAAIEDIYSDHRIPADAYRPTFVKSLLMMPVNTDNPVAAIGAYWSSRHNPDPLEIELLQEVCRSVAASYDLIRLLQEKEKLLDDQIRQNHAMLNELYHRLKNNLNMVNTFLYFSQEKTKDPVSIAAFEDAIARIDTIRYIYDQLSFSKLGDRVRISKYLDTLIDAIIHSNTVHTKKIIVNKSIDDFEMPFNKAITVGLIINELIANSIKHAFTINDIGLISIALAMKDNTVTIHYTDNGPGFAAETATSGMGMKIIDAFVQQLSGSKAMETKANFMFRMTFEL